MARPLRRIVSAPHTAAVVCLNQYAHVLTDKHNPAPHFGPAASPNGQRFSVQEVLPAVRARAAAVH